MSPSGEHKIVQPGARRSQLINLETDPLACSRMRMAHIVTTRLLLLHQLQYSDHVVEETNLRWSSASRA